MHILHFLFLSLVQSALVSGSLFGKLKSPSTHTPASKGLSTPNLPSNSDAFTYGSGGGKMFVFTGGPYRGRLVGGGSRSTVYGTSVYGSGYPGRPHGSSGVAGQPFPYYFHPVVWQPPLITPYPPYLNAIGEYGAPTDASRPGGALMQATFRSNTTADVFYLLADNSTAYALLSIIRASCSVHGNLDNATSSSTLIPYTGGNGSDVPRAVDAVQYFRASSAVLTLENYNNSIALSSNPNATASPLPAGVDATLLTCLNATIEAAIPLVDAPPEYHLNMFAYIMRIVLGLCGLVVWLIIVALLATYCAQSGHYLFLALICFTVFFCVQAVLGWIFT